MEAVVLERLDIGAADDRYRKEVDAVFFFIGARPYTDWLGELLARNTRGFVLTGEDVRGTGGFGCQWKQGREPFLLETDMPGVFAAGDVRAGAMNRVASAVGEGSMAIKYVHAYLGEA